MTSIQPGSIVVGADGSADANRAVEWAAEQAAIERRPLVVFTAALQAPEVVGAWPGPSYVLPAEELLVGAQAVADEAAAIAIRHRPGLRSQVVTSTMASRTALADLSSGAHLLVLGSRGRGPVASKLLGSVSASVVEHAACPVVVCRPGDDPHTKKGVLVGADGTDQSLPVIDFAFRQASLRSQPLTVLHSFFDSMVTVATARSRSAAPDLEEPRFLVARSLADLSERYPDVQFTVQFARGHAVDALAAIADNHDLVVVGHHPDDTVADRLGVAIATAVLERCHTNIAVVPEPASSWQRN